MLEYLDTFKFFFKICYNIYKKLKLSINMVTQYSITYIKSFNLETLTFKLEDVLVTCSSIVVFLSVCFT